VVQHPKQTRDAADLRQLVQMLHDLHEKVLIETRGVIVGDISLVLFVFFILVVVLGLLVILAARRRNAPFECRYRSRRGRWSRFRQGFCDSVGYCSCLYRSCWGDVRSDN
jgi:hypothetical protein